ncbi:MAG: TRAM domain-containing protein [Deltaproteobacteria bacterium]|nr:TRAM domain-containing protein [Deltaproteobacteria bacterium]MBW2305720.1 TRAM domain-containing protein [Deltaproteobacteria bacterium]
MNYEMIRIMLKILLALACSVSIAIIFYELFSRQDLALVGGVIGLIIAFLILASEQYALKSPLKVMIGGALGAITGLVMANLFAYAFLLDWKQSPTLGLSAYILANSVLGYLGLALGTKKAEDFDPNQLIFFTRNRPSSENIKILDTSVIIDGRFADICETGFIDGIMMIPQFVLHELQRIADSADSLKRTKGRRGLDILNRMQKQVDLNVRILEQDFPKIRDVDSKLIALAKKLNGKILTNDFNLNKVAELHGVTVLNINQLANALKPVVLPGEVMKVQIIKEGKEQGQGIGYLDDGTMVVVESARRFLGKSVEVAVTSVLQTTAGRMIFTILKDNGRELLHHARS